MNAVLASPTNPPTLTPSNPSLLHPQAWYSQMNAALRQAAPGLGLPLVDFELMASPLGFSSYLKVRGAAECAHVWR